MNISTQSLELEESDSGSSLTEPLQELRDRQWNMSAGNLSRSFELESWSYIQHKDHQLQLLQKKEITTDRRSIPATFRQRLSFYRMYYTSSFKIEMCTILQIEFNPFIWNILLSTLFKTLPYSYIVMFLSIYSPEEHLFVSKMIPLFWGCKIQVLIASFTELLTSSDVLVILFDYVFNGFMYLHPWNKCAANNTQFFGRKIVCLTMEKFKEKVRTENVSNDFFWFKTNDTKGPQYFWTAQQDFYAKRRLLYFSSEVTIVDVIIRGTLWAIAAYCVRFVFSKMFWKIFNIFHWTLNCLWLFILCFCIYHRDETKSKNVISENARLPVDFRIIDFALLSESTSGPPILHVLTARSTEPVNPGWDSFAIASSNMIYVTFRAIVGYFLKIHCEGDVGLSYVLNTLNAYPFFFYYPAFFYKMYLGDVFTMIYFTSKFLTDFMIFIVLFNCLKETIFCEWKFTKVQKWIVIVSIVVAAFVVLFVTKSFSRSVLLIYGHFLPTLTEILVVMLFYPIGRLLDDIRFHYGNELTKLRNFNIYIFPIFYTAKVYKSLYHLHQFYEINVFKVAASHGNFQYACKYFWIINIVPIVFGFFYAIYKVVFKEKKRWLALFTPCSTWGPQEFVVRQLRKRYESREFVPSQSSRYLARHMMAKAEADTYKLDVRYETVFKKPSDIGKEVDRKIE